MVRERAFLRPQLDQGGLLFGGLAGSDVLQWEAGVCLCCCIKSLRLHTCVAFCSLLCLTLPVSCTLFPAGAVPGVLHLLPLLPSPCLSMARPPLHFACLQQSCPQVRFQESRISFLSFITSLCAIIGGVFTGGKLLTTSLDPVAVPAARSSAACSQVRVQHCPSRIAGRLGPLLCGQ